MVFKQSVTLGDIVQVITLIAAALGLYSRLSDRITTLEGKIGILAERLNPIYKWWNKNVSISGPNQESHSSGD